MGKCFYEQNIANITTTPKTYIIFYNLLLRGVYKTEVPTNNTVI